MSNLNEEKNSQVNGAENPVAPPETGRRPDASPAGEYWVRGGVGQQRPTTPHGYGQGYSQPPQYGRQYSPPPYGPPGYQPPRQPGQQPLYRPGQYQYSAGSGWQQTTPRPPESYQWNFEDYDKAAGSKASRRRSRGVVVFVVSLVCVIALGIMSFAGWGVYSYLIAGEPGAMESEVSDAEGIVAENAAEPLELASKPQISDTLPVGGKMTVPQIAKAVRPSVVGVKQYRPEMSYVETGEGSGIIMSADGYVITNEHVVRDGQAFKVILPDGTPYDAELVGSDRQTDLAVLKVSGVTGLTPAVFGDSTQIEVGETALVIGNPGGTTLAGSVTQGIISAVNRVIPGSEFTIPLIQTDAAINPGNSGGALVNEYGQVIGIPSSKLVSSGFEGICFAIPISEAKPIIDDIVANGRVTGRVQLGIRAQQIDEIDARNYGLMVGIRIAEIFPYSDLVNTPIQRFDIITHIDGERVTDNASLKRILDRYDPGDRVTLTIFRAINETRNETFDVEIELKEADE